MAGYLNQQIQRKRDVGWDAESAVADVFESCDDPRMFFELMRDGVRDEERGAPGFLGSSKGKDPVVRVGGESSVSPEQQSFAVRKPRTVFASFKAPSAVAIPLVCDWCGYVGMDCGDDGACLVCPSCATCKDNRLNDCVYMACPFSDFLSNASYYNGQERRVRYSRNNYFLENLHKVLGNEFLCQDVQRHPNFGPLLKDPKARAAAAEGGAVALKDYMRGLKLGRLFYQHAHSICVLLLGAGTKKPRLHEYTVLELEKLFNKAVEAYERIRGGRKNFLNYGYVLRRLLLMVGREDLTDSIPVLKTKGRLLEHNKFWSEICRINRWPISVDCP